MSDAHTYGVYVKPCGAVTPTDNTITGSGQVTIVLPLGNNIANLENHAGIWDNNATISGPVEAPGYNYFAFGFLSDSPKIIFEAGKETLLFTFEVVGSALSVPSLIENESDPLAFIPNSLTSSFANDIGVIDFGINPVGYYGYSGNYTDENGTSCTTEVDTSNTSGENPTATLEETEGAFHFSVSPNPANHWLKVDFSKKEATDKGMVRLWTTSGVSIGEMERDGQHKMKWNVSNLPSGLYYLSFESDGEVLQRERFMKL